MNENNCNTGKLFRVLYFSRAHSEAAANIAQAFPAILDTAQHKNPRLDITGALLACSGWFLQILEGPRNHVESTLNCIRCDARHRDLRVVRSGLAFERYFPHWSMCGRALSPTDDEIVSVLEKDGIFDPRKISADQGATLLKRISFMQDKYFTGNCLQID